MWISLNDREKEKSYCVKKSPFTERRSTLTVAGARGTLPANDIGGIYDALPPPPHSLNESPPHSM